MNANSTRKALVCIDFINDIVHPEGKLAKKGYADFVDRRSTLKNVSEAQGRFRSEGSLVISVRVGFASSYLDLPTQSPLFGKAGQFRALELGTWGTAFADQVAPADGDFIINKPRVSAFYGTSLEALLRNQAINDVFLAGVATDLAVQSAARDAHDRDFIVMVLADCCAAANDSDHQNSLAVLSKIATVKTVEEYLKTV
jgi:ureidoacrylate peracid hydrolase